MSSWRLAVFITSTGPFSDYTCRDLRARLGPNIRDAIYLIEFVLERVSNLHGAANQPQFSDPLNKLAIEAMKSFNVRILTPV